MVVVLRLVFYPVKTNWCKVDLVGVVCFMVFVDLASEFGDFNTFFRWELVFVASIRDRQAASALRIF